jgi:RluA family pseudouridine synthase
LIVVNKPAPLPVHACGRFNRNTLDWMLQQVYRPQRLKMVHRLDADTTGLMVVARHRRAATWLQECFRHNRVEKVYLARVHGHPAVTRFDSQAAIGGEPTELGLRMLDPQGLPAETNFRVLERWVDGTSLIEARPITGRTNQIRLHLWDLGWPIVGDTAYLPGRQLGHNASRQPGQEPLCLHAWKLSFLHPFPDQATGRTSYGWETPKPAWAEPSGMERERFHKDSPSTPPEGLVTDPTAAGPATGEARWAR